MRGRNTTSSIRSAQGFYRFLVLLIPIPLGPVVRCATSWPTDRLVTTSYWQNYVSVIFFFLDFKTSRCEDVIKPLIRYYLGVVIVKH